jgi:membrane protease YdiL (CAAX protease family)
MLQYFTEMKMKLLIKFGINKLFFLLIFILSWGCWIPAGFLSAEKHGVLINILHYAGGLMPTLVTLLFLFIFNSAQERQDYWNRLIDFRRIKANWTFVIFLTVPVLMTIASRIDILLGGNGGNLDYLSTMMGTPSALLLFAIFTLLFGPLPEEMAWRGYALKNLLLKNNALTASLMIGIVWTLWHLPLFGIPGTYQQGLGFGTQQFWLYMLDKIPQSIFMTWIFVNNRRSTISAILFHFMINFMGELIDLSLRAETVYIIAWWVGAVIVLMVFKPKTLTRNFKISG